MDKDRKMFPFFKFEISHKSFEIVDVYCFIHVISAAYILTWCRADTTYAQWHGIMLSNDHKGIFILPFSNKTQISGDIDLCGTCGLAWGCTCIKLIPIEHIYAF